MKATHNLYTVSPTAAPIRAAPNAVEMTDPVIPFRRFDGGRSVGECEVMHMSLTASEEG